MMLFFYRLLLLLSSPLTISLLFIRWLRNKEDRKRFRERFGFAVHPRPAGQLLWFNAVSIGEINSIWPLICKINIQKQYFILITTTSITSAQLVNKKINRLSFSEKVLHQYSPLDFSTTIWLFLRHWRPNLLITVESEFWPNLFAITCHRCPVLVINGKLSAKSYKFWCHMRGLGKYIFGNISMCLAQTRESCNKFAELGVKNVKFLGNMKFFAERQPVNRKLKEKFEQEFISRKRWLVNCIHLQEIEIILEVHKKLKQIHPSLITFLVLRHPEDIKKIEEKLQPLKYTSSSNWLGETGEIANGKSQELDFFIHDIYGDLGTFFDFCQLVFMGGSLKESIGGHTPIEAVYHHCCVVTGPYVINNQLLFQELAAVGGCILLPNTSSESFFSIINSLLKNDVEIKKISQNTQKSNAFSKDLPEKVIEIISDFLA